MESHIPMENPFRSFGSELHLMPKAGWLMGRMLLGLCAFAAAEQSVRAQPSNDQCSGAITLTLGTTAVDLTGATSSIGSPACLPLTDADVWYRYTPTQTGPLRIVARGAGASAFAAALAVYESCADVGGAPLMCSESQGIDGTALLLEAVAGEEVFIAVVSEFGLPAEPWSISIEEVAPPANDLCENATPVGLGTVAFDTSTALTQLATTCGINGPSGADVWYRFTAPTTGRVTVSACDPNFEGTHPNTVLSLHPACGAAPMRCNDSDCIETGQASLSFAVTAGASYLVRLAGVEYEDGPIARGAGTLEFAQRTATFPAGDECSNPRNIGEGSFTWNNLNATTNQLTASNAPAITRDIWYRYTPTQSGTAQITTCATTGTQRNTAIAVYDSCTDATAISNDDAGLCSQSGGSAVYARVVAGTPILIRVGTPTPDEAGGGGVLNVAVLPTPANDLCENATPVGEGTHLAELRGSFQDRATFCDQFLFPSDSDVWYSYTATSDGELTVVSCLAQNPLAPAVAILSSCFEVTTHCNEISCAGGGVGANRLMSAGETVLIRIASQDISSYAAPISFDVSFEPRCTLGVNVPQGALLEASPCGEWPDTNDGCRLAGAIAASLGQTWEGRTSDFEIANRFRRDLDAYVLTLTEQTDLVIEGEAQSLMRVALSSADGCAPSGTSPILLAQAYNSEACSDFRLTRTVPAGQYEVQMRPERPLIYVPFDCSSGRNVYWVRFASAGPACNTIDFNNDGLFPDDQDLIDFLSVLAGGPCSNDPSCAAIDFNNDGLFPDDNDLIAFLRVLAGGSC